jgi:hypothetical protein
MSGAHLGLAAQEQRVQRLLAEFDQQVSKGDALLQEARQKRAALILKARNDVVRNLKRLIRRGSDGETQALIYRRVLSFDREDADAVAFFTKEGSLELVLAELEPVVDADFLGELIVSGPAAAPSGPAGQLRIESAEYGAGEAWLDVTEQVRAALSTETGLSLHVSNTWAGSDPAHGIRKELLITFAFGSVRWEESFGEGAQVNLSLDDLRARVNEHRVDF